MKVSAGPKKPKAPKLQKETTKVRFQSPSGTGGDVTMTSGQYKKRF